MKKKLLLLLMLCLSAVATAFAQEQTDIYGLLTTIEHPKEPSKGAVLAIMTESAYIPIELGKDEYVAVSEPQLLCGKEIQLDSIYHFVRTEENGVFSYSFEQLYKGAKYVTERGCFVTEPMGIDPETGIALPGVFFYFLTDSEEHLTPLDFTPRKDPLHEGFAPVLGGWSVSHTYDRSNLGSLYTIRFVKIKIKNDDFYIPTHVVSSDPTSTINVPEDKEVSIAVNGNELSVTSQSPMAHIALIDISGRQLFYQANGATAITVPIEPKSLGCILRVTFEDNHIVSNYKILL